MIAKRVTDDRKILNNEKPMPGIKQLNAKESIKRIMMRVNYRGYNNLKTNMK